MIKRYFAVFLIVVLLFSCSEETAILPTPTNTLATTKELSKATEKIVTLTPMLNQSSTPIKVTTVPSTMDASLETQTPPHPCPDQWFKFLEPSPSPIFLLIWGSLYMAYRFDFPPDKSFFDLPIDPAKSFAVSFSQDQQSIAYFQNEETSKSAELWISDLTLCNPILVYRDQEGRIGDPSSFTYFQWGPGDKTLIFRSDENEFPLLVYNLENREIDFWHGSCEKVLHMVDVNELVIGCTHDEKYSYLYPDGRITTVASIPKQTGDPVLTWSFSRKGDSAYITSTKEVYLLRKSGQKTKLPLEGFTTAVALGFDPLHWSANSERLLVLAYDPLENRCPPDLACWFVVDGESGEIVWWLKPETIDEEKYWNEIDTIHPAALSPDGKLLAIQYYRDPGMTLSIIQLSTNEVISKNDVFSDLMAWPTH